MNSLTINEFKNKLYSNGYNFINDIIVNPTEDELIKKENKYVLFEKINFLTFLNCDLSNITKILIKDVDNSLENSSVQFSKIDADIVYLKNCNLNTLMIFESNINTLIFENSTIDILEINGSKFKDIKNEYKLPVYLTMIDFDNEEDDFFKIKELSIYNTEVENNIHFNYLESIDINLGELNCSSLILFDCIIKSNLLIQDSIIKNLSIESLKNNVITYCSIESNNEVFNNYFKLSKTFIINDFYFNDINLDKLELSECRIMCSMIWKNVNLNTTQLLNTTLEKNFKFFNLNISNLSTLDDETCRVYKSYALKNNDQSSFLKFNMLEQNKLFENKRINDSDYWILLCKKYFSNHGTSWAQAVFATIGLSFLFYIPIFIFLKTNFAFCQLFSSEFLNGFIRFLNITDYFNPIVFDKRVYIDNTLALILMFLGKIVLGIGIYETITSFRKYHK